MAQLISTYFWLGVLAVLGLNYRLAHKAVLARSQLGVETNVAIEKYLRLYWGGMAIPWLIVGVGTLAGATPSIWYYFRPQDGNPFVLAWLASVFVASVSYALWVFHAGGARIASQASLLTAQGRSRGVGQSETMVKIVALGTVLICPVWIYIAVRMNAPLPKW